MYDDWTDHSVRLKYTSPQKDDAFRSVDYAMVEFVGSPNDKGANAERKTFNTMAAINGNSRMNEFLWRLIFRKIPLIATFVLIYALKFQMSVRLKDLTYRSFMLRE